MTLEIFGEFYYLKIFSIMQASKEKKIYLEKMFYNKKKKKL